MSDRAKVLTTAEIESWGVALGKNWGAKIGPRGHEVVIEGDRLLATTRALDELEEGVRLWHGTPPDERARLAIDKAGELWRSAVAERDSAIARAEKTQTELLHVHDALHQECSGKADLPGEIRALRARAEKAERERAALLKALLETVPTEYVDGRWVVSSGGEPQAVITYTLESSPETRHVGWCWWALGKMGDASSYDAACRAAVAAVREVERRHSPRVCRFMAKAKPETKRGAS